MGLENGTDGTDGDWDGWDRGDLSGRGSITVRASDLKWGGVQPTDNRKPKTENRQPTTDN
jgi:hypothetical protein